MEPTVEPDLGRTTLDDRRKQGEPEELESQVEPVPEATSPPGREAMDKAQAPHRQRLTAVKTFTSDTNPESLARLDEHIAAWLRSRPDVEVKKTDAAAMPGSLIVLVWY